MSENVQNDAQWNKTTTPSTAATATTIGGRIIASSRISFSADSAAPPTVLYSPNMNSANHPDGIYAAARFQAPSIHQHHHHHHLNSPTMSATTSTSLPQHLSINSVPAITSNFTHHHATIVSSSTNVPLYASPPSAAVTSVVTPNPFAASNASSVATMPPTAARPFALQQFFHAMNTAAAASLVGNAAVATPLNLNTPSPSQIVIPTGMATSPASNSGLSRTTNIDVPSPSSIASSAGGCGGGSTLLTTSTVGAITSTITENVINAISGGVSQGGVGAAAVTPARNMGLIIKPVPDEDKLQRLHQTIEATIGEQAKQQIVQILDCISTLKPVEKLLLYLRLPGAAPETDPLRQPQNPLGTRSEINHTINWVRSHLEQDPHVSIPKQDVYNDYIAYCERLDIKPLSTADFGKVMKQVFPGIRPRRLGTRGHSRYCYAAMRKTTKLPSPQLPQLGSGNNNSENFKGDGIETFTDNTDAFNNGADVETWSTIKNWAEGLLQTKLDGAKDLADRIKSGNIPGFVGNLATGSNRVSITHKKFGNRETKEKRFMTDMGPLKKRRKKKRKGSSSSESSYGSQQALQKQSHIDKEVSKTIIATEKAEQAEQAATVTLIKVKEEILESPTFNRAQQHHATTPNYLQQQIWPINLAPEQRSVLTRAPASSSSSSSSQSTAFNLATSRATAAAKNLVPKIIELSTASAVVASTTSAMADAALPTTSTTSATTVLIPTIKEEEVDEYNTSNILCKKVRKAQQTKGFWQQTTTSIPTTTIVTLTPPTPTTVTTTLPQPHILVPVITTSAATPTPTPTVANVAESTASPVNSFLMGPPAAASSTSPFSITESGGGSVTPTPKVASKNMQQLRAKRMQIIAAAAAAAAAANEAANSSSNPADDLPENLGLPRERVISICNMDKHELDDYFINAEVEEDDNSNEPDTELLQYFQTGDAEEKLNSLDAGKQRNSTALAANNLVNNQSQNVVTSQLPLQQQQQQHNTTQVTKTLTTTIVATTTTATTTKTSLAAQISLPVLSTTTTNSAMTTTTLTAAVGSASASLALMSQKHQVQQLLQNTQQQQQKQQQQQPQLVNSVAIKRKLLPTKHCTFAPISPNINSNATSATVTISSSASNGVHFASPGITLARVKPKSALLAKQHSLDVDLSAAITFPSPSMTTMYDPMIGASRRRRTYVNNSTSASAPPSPSILHQNHYHNHQHHHHHHNGGQQFQNAANQWLTTTSFLNDQNSLDLDLFGGSAASNTSNYVGVIGAAGTLSALDEYTTETQRSQSVPLSQLQRIHSPPLGNLSGLPSTSCTNKNDYIVGGGGGGGENSLMCSSENSCSQHSDPTSATAAAIIKLEDPAVADVMASDSAALLDNVDVNEILSSPDFVQNFTSIAAHQQGNSINATITTTCSSAGSSSGYSSGACTTFNSGGGNIMSRSVPSTPLPHHHQNIFGQSSSTVSFYNQRRRSGITNDELQLSPCSGFNNNSANTYGSGNGNGNGNGNVSFSNTFGSRSIYDISKSMPSTPITTPSFRYSPEFNRDFLINGNTIDDSISFGAVGSDSLMATSGPTSVSATGDDDSVNLVSNLNPDALLSVDDVSVPGADDVLLGNL